MTAPKSSARLAAPLALAVLAIAGCVEQSTITTPSVPASGFDVLATTPGTVYICPNGPAGNYTYSVTVSVPAAWSDPPYSGTLTGSEIALTESNQTVVGSPVIAAGSCALVFEITAPTFFDRGDGLLFDPVRDVTVQQTGAPAGTQLDSIVTLDDQNGTSVVVAPATTVEVSLNDFHGAVLSFYNSTHEITITPCPAGSFSYTFTATGDLAIKYDQFPAPNDNSYGVNAVGWPNGHKFNDLVGSDHAGFQLVDPNGVVKLSFNVDYLSAKPGTPSGYGSLGVSGGDGKMLVGTAAGITAITSLDQNLNNINIPGLFVGGVQQFGSVNLFVNSPPVSPANAYNNTDPTLVGWDFHNTYYVTITAAKLASLGFDAATWKVLPNADQLHNSPAKPCPPSGAALTVTKYEVKDKQVKITIQNSGDANTFLTALTLNWPASNGKLMKIKLDGDVVFDTDTAAGPISLTTAQLVADSNKRKIDKNSSDVYTLEFQNNASSDLSLYAGTVTFDNSTTLTLLPQ